MLAADSGERISFQTLVRQGWGETAVTGWGAAIIAADKNTATFKEALLSAKLSSVTRIANVVQWTSLITSILTFCGKLHLGIHRLPPTE